VLVIVPSTSHESSEPHCLVVSVKVHGTHGGGGDAGGAGGGDDGVGPQRFCASVRDVPMATRADPVEVDVGESMAQT